MNLIKSGIISLHGAVVSMQGGRPENQDDWGFLDTPLGFLVIVCDGMGGGPGGKTASYIVKYEIATALCECNAQTPRENALKMAVARANEALDRKMEEVPSLCGMGSTFVAVLISNQSAFVAHAGDSRCYRFHGKKCMYRSNDHSLVAELVKKKAFTEEEARLSPQSNVISRGLGSTSNHIPEIEEIPFSKGDRFVLCTDGVWGSMPHDELLKRFTSSTDLKTLVGNLSAEIDRIGLTEGGNHDNHTLVVFDMDMDSILSIKKRRWLYYVGFAILVVISVIFVCTVIYIKYKKDKAKSETLANSYVSSGSAMSTEYTFQVEERENKDSLISYDVAVDSMLPSRDSIKKEVAIALEKKIKNEKSEEEPKESVPENKEERSVFEIISASIDSLTQTRCKKESEAVKKQEAHIKFIKSKLEEIIRSDANRGRKKRADRTIGHMNSYKNLNKVQVDPKQPKTFIPTQYALDDMKDLRKRIDWVKEME